MQLAKATRNERVLCHDGWQVDEENHGREELDEDRMWTWKS